MPKKKKPVQKAANAELLTQEQITLEEVEKLLDGDTTLAMFFLEWLNNGLNAKMAYLKFHPNVQERSAEVLGSRELRKVEVATIMEALGVGASPFFSQLAAGLNAEKKAVLRKYDKQGNIVQELDLSQPDHKTRAIYNERQGRMLGLEKEKGDKTINYFDFSRLGGMIKADREERGLPL